MPWSIMNPEILKELVSMRMPFGKYKGKLLCDLPDSYVEWFYFNGLPAGKFGMLMGTLYEIKINGLDYILDQIREQ